jgi:transposase
MLTMFTASAGQVYLVVGHVDMRKSFDSLSIMVAKELSLNPLGGCLFAFSNRRRTVVKVLYWCYSSALMAGMGSVSVADAGSEKSAGRRASAVVGDDR